VYCTIFDSNYLARALVLHSSLMRVNRDALFAFFCIDERSAELLDMLQLERSIVIRHEEFSSPELAKIQPLRNRGEYCWTCKPIAIEYLMGRIQNADWVVYVDTDMMFFSDPDAVLVGQAAHYLLTPHRFHRKFIGFEKGAGSTMLVMLLRGVPRSAKRPSTVEKPMPGKLQFDPNRNHLCGSKVSRSIF
jgi:hypothetical protein